MLEDRSDERLDADAHYMLAVARRYKGDPEGALEVVDELIALRPEYGRAFQERGYALLAADDPEAAVAAFRRAVELNPGLVSSWRALGELYDRAGNTGSAAFVRGQLEYLESLPRELVGVIDLVHEGRLKKAEEACRAFLEQHRHHIEAMRLFADIAIRLRIYDDAEFLLESCVELAPENSRARADYVAILNRKGKFRQALDQAEILCEASPDNPVYLIAKGSALTGLGRLDEGIDCLKAGLLRTSNKPGVLVMLGHAYKAQGEIDDAVAAYREAYRQRPGYGDAYWSLANTKTYRFTDDELADIEREERIPGASADDRTHLCFAAGKAYEDRGDYAKSFGFYRRGNAMKARSGGYDSALTREMVDAQIECCDAGLFETRGNAGYDAPDPIFIVGLPRAGSTLIEQILASHSEVDGTMELHEILGLVQRLRGRSASGDSRYPDNLRTLDADYFRRFGEKFIADTRAYRAGAPYFIDKMPNNFMHIGLIRLILPRAKVIDARRHPMACCFSGFKQLFGEGQDFTYDLETIGRYYRDYVRLMDHWDEVLPDFVLRVEHEDVIDDLEGQVRRMLDFCGLPFEEACLRFHETRRNIKTPSSEQVRQPLYRSGLDQWRRYERWLDPLKEALGPELRRRFAIE